MLETHELQGVSMEGLRGTALAAALLSVASLAQAADPQRGGTAIYVQAQDPPGVNPDIISGLPNRFAGCTIFEGLVNVAQTYEIVPALAKSWSISPDQLTYSFELTPTEFHDGKPVTAEDVKYTLQEVSTKYSAVFLPAGKVIDTIETPAPDKVVIKLKQPFGPFLMSLACNQGSAILPSHQFKGSDPLTNPGNTINPIGTGAFKFQEWKRGDYIKFARNPKYREPGKPYLDAVIGKTIPSTAAGLQALLAGEVDIIQSFPPGNKAAVEANPKLKVMESDQPAVTTFIMVNIDRKPFGDKRVRQALYRAIDRDYLMKNAFFNIGKVSAQPFPSNISWAVDPALDLRKMYPFDIAKANEELDEAGVKRGSDGKRLSARLVIYAHEYPEFLPAATAIKSVWQQLGIDLTIDQLETATIIEKVFKERDFDLVMLTYNSFADPVFGIAREYVGPSVGKAFGNATGYANPVVDALFEKGERATAPEERGKFYKEAQAILAIDNPSLKLREYKNLDAATKRLEGFAGNLMGNGRWADAWLSK